MDTLTKDVIRRIHARSRWMEIYRTETSTWFFRLKARFTHPCFTMTLWRIWGLLRERAIASRARLPKPSKTERVDITASLPTGRKAWVQDLDAWGDPAGEPYPVDSHTLEPIGEWDFI